ncbi:MAG TPA: glutamine--tRNA ligase/YqeY domain fusion protein [Candidatus Omnitrophota bacterium]|nr:glutamine--tRNA ligase/YqeY domain fusion protein [Candidatus Omnitrophota bacterium]HPB67289.1 glutamine--tRNA ligase/YqeY domain fusion protein [Candidatus Omnitrophota bacterium]HQO57426.1 glutamine--tRNA ligase/YqeY domain fusion protein [Candidatus Omnitrophota bacterium]HQP12186.1 glutamine--tRNA ligase/YqeY domain fusion protein [Candidatus Omnitrophota bacterium]
MSSHENSIKKPEDYPSPDSTQSKSSADFIRAIVAEDIASGKHGGKVVTRFPPEPNGYLHIGHAKSICLNFGIAKENNGMCHLRFDDTNPCKEEDEYVQSIQNDVRWLGFDWKDKLFFASDYFEQLYQYAEQLIKIGRAYVDSQSAEDIRRTRGTLTDAGQESPYRNRSVEENLDLFQRMRRGEYEEGQHVVRAKIDMASPNINMRDPTIFRIRKAAHHRTGTQWCVYPMYDFAHCLSDAIEGITHSVCTLEFENHRPLYDWFLNELKTPCHPQQIEFARLNLTYTVMSKRKLLELVSGRYVRGWDDPRMPTLSGLRRRGYTPDAIRTFCERIGVAKMEGTVDVSFLEHCLREDLNKKALRVFAVLRPLKVVITNYPEGQTEELEAVNNPEDPQSGTRRVRFSRVLYIEKDDFRENPPPKFYRLSPGQEVRLRYAYFITCQEVIKDRNGEVTELRCTYDPASRGGDSPDGRKVKATLHWVSAEHAFDAEVRLYDYLFSKPDPSDTANGQDYKENLNPNSLEILRNCKMEEFLRQAQAGVSYQFERLGYFCVDPVDSAPGQPVFNRTVTLRDSWAKIEKSQKR